MTHSPPTGALTGLGLQPDSRGRVYLDLGTYMHQGIWLLAPILGGGIRLSEHTEAEIQVPLALGHYTFGTEGDLGNVTLALHYVDTEGPLRFEAGSAVSFPTARGGDSLNGALPEAFQRMPLWFPYYLMGSLPVHAEVGKTLVGTLDASLQAVALPYGWWFGSPDVASVLAPGVGFWTPWDLVVGFRLPWAHVYTEGDPYNNEFSMEPYLRSDIRDLGFVSARFNQPIGGFIDFGEGWGLMLGGGLSCRPRPFQ